MMDNAIHQKAVVAKRAPLPGMTRWERFRSKVGIGTPLTEDAVMKRREAEFSAMPADKLLIYAMRTQNGCRELACRKAMEKFIALGQPEKENVMLRMQEELSYYSSFVFEHEYKAGAVTIIADFLTKAAKSLPHDSEGEKISTPYKKAIDRLVGVVNDTSFYNATPEQKNTILTCATALWEMGYGSYEFWEHQLSYEVTRDFVITKLLEMEPTKNPEEHGWHLLKQHLDGQGTAIAVNPSEKRYGFFTEALQSPDPEITRNAFLAAIHLENPSEDLLSKMARPIKAAIAIYSDSRNTEPEAAEAADTFIRTAFAQLVSLRYSSSPHLQPVIDNLVSFTSKVVLNVSHKNDITSGCTEKSAEIIAFLTASGALPRPSPIFGGGILTEDARAIEKARTILLNMLNYGDERQFSAAHSLINLYPTGHHISDHQLISIGKEMASIAIEPPAKNEKETRAKAIGVIARIYGVGIDTSAITASIKDEFAKMDTEQQKETLGALQQIFTEHAPAVFENDVKTSAVAAMADIFAAAAPHMRAEKDKEYKNTVQHLMNVTESRDNFIGSYMQKKALTACANVLWQVGEGDYDFWAGRLVDWPTADFTVTAMLEAGFEGEHGKSRMQLLKDNLDQISQLVWEKSAEKKTEFLRSMLASQEPKDVIGALHSAFYMPKIPEDFMATATDLLPDGKKDTKDEGVRNAATVFLTTSAAKEQLLVREGMFNAADALIDIYSAGNPHLERMLHRVAAEMIPLAAPVDGQVIINVDSATPPTVKNATINVPKELAVQFMASGGKLSDTQNAALNTVVRISMLGLQIPGVRLNVMEEAPKEGPLTETIIKGETNG